MRVSQWLHRARAQSPVGFHLTLILAAAALSLAACGQTDTAAQQPATAAASKVDSSFINTAGGLGLAEARLAQLTATTAADPATRDFAKQVAADHATVDPQLAALAQDQGLAPASDLDAAHETLYRQLQTLRGPATWGKRASIAPASRTSATPASLRIAMRVVPA